MRKIHSDIQLSETDRAFPYNLFYHTDLSIHNHWHTEIEIIRVKTNNMKMHIGGEPHSLSEGDILLVASGDIHSITRSSHTRMVIQFEADILETKYISGREINGIRDRLGLLERSSTKWPQSANEKANEVLDALEKIECELKGTQYKMKVQELLCTLVNLLIESVPKSETMVESNLLLHNKKAIKNLEKVFSYLRDNYTEGITLADVSALLNYSQSYFQKIWKRYIGISFHEYLNEYRLERASQMLLDTNMQVSEVCFAAGFQNLKTFNRVFKSAHGLSPSEYRQGIK